MGFCNSGVNKACNHMITLCMLWEWKHWVSRAGCAPCDCTFQGSTVVRGAFEQESNTSAWSFGCQSTHCYLRVPIEMHSDWTLMTKQSCRGLTLFTRCMFCTLIQFKSGRVEGFMSGGDAEEDELQPPENRKGHLRYMFTQQRKIVRQNMDIGRGIR